MRTRITVVFDGAKFNYEASISKESILTELNNIKKENGYLHFIDVEGNDIRITPSKIPLLEIVELEIDSNDWQTR